MMIKKEFEWDGEVDTRDLFDRSEKLIQSSNRIISDMEIQVQQCRFLIEALTSKIKRNQGL
ncbi:hypothetical protein OQZ33_21680 [Pedobacter sp. MC2016-05]|uniref:hypothetical protein n=1 Tax=Pedobacter sp. MC2016-05 TaxID=2994474 RepID=UPI002245535E|nr:hypothetical protein [Pedobacter sp. MC2016-05]MCX2476960.1 hypothetical protein [Pedobacter sp. MC2016-05]